MKLEIAAPAGGTGGAQATARAGFRLSAIRRPQGVNVSGSSQEVIDEEGRGSALIPRVGGTGRSRGKKAEGNGLCLHHDALCGASSQRFRERGFTGLQTQWTGWILGKGSLEIELDTRGSLIGRVSHDFRELLNVLLDDGDVDLNEHLRFREAFQSQ